MALTCDDNRLTTPDDARLLLTLALRLALSGTTVQDPRHRGAVTASLRRAGMQTNLSRR
jgi:hypothetical protein